MNNVVKDLGDGLLLKQSTIEDVERLADYNSRYLSDEGPDEPEEFIKHWTRDMMLNHPTMTAGDFTYVEDSQKEQIVSALCLISQTWSYESIPFGVGRIELVSTHPEYRKRGLIRAQFEAVHEWSAQRGEKAQAITGIPYFYRQFGYEMTVNLGGNRRGYRPHVPKLKEEEKEQFLFRPATAEEIPFLLQMYDLGRERSLLPCPRNEQILAYEMETQHASFRSDMVVIEDLEQQPVGFVWHGSQVRHGRIGTHVYELKPEASWAAVTPALIRYLAQKGEALAAQDEKQEWEAFSFELGGEHPAYEVAEKHLPEENPPYAWYLRVPDLPDFVEHIRPVLNERLAASLHAGYEGELKLDFFRSGLKLIFEAGKLSRAESWQPSTEERGDIAFPPRTFLHVLFGHRSFAELEEFYPDCYRGSKQEAPALIDVLFPKKASRILGIV